MQNLTVVNWISISGIVVPIIVSIIGVILQWIITSIRINKNDNKNDMKIRVNRIIDYLEHLRSISTEYWGKISMTP